MRWDRITLSQALIVAGLLWLALLWLWPAALQSHVFYRDGTEAFWDYRLPQACVASPNVYEPEGISRVDAPYPALGYLVTALFPRDVFTGGLIFTVLSILVLLTGAWLVSRDGWRTAAVIFMAPVLHAIGVGNQILLAMGGVLVFLAWKDEHGWKKHVAFLSLAFATALKIVPCVFGLALLKERRWRDFALLSAFCAILLFVPFAWTGGLDGFAAFLENLRLHDDHYGIRSRYGLVPFDRSFRILTGRGVESVRQTFAVSRGLSVALGAACLWRWWRAPDRTTEWTMLAAAALFLSSVTQFYSLIYLLPSVLIGARTGGWRPLFLFAALCPLQIPALHGGANMLLSNFALLCLTLDCLVRPRGCRGRISDF